METNPPSQVLSARERPPGCDNATAFGEHLTDAERVEVVLGYMCGRHNTERRIRGLAIRVEKDV